MIYNDYWSTPIAEFYNSDDEVFNDIVETINNHLHNPSISINVNLLENNKIFSEWVLSCVKQYCAKFTDGSKTPNIERGWCVVQRKFDANQIHSHAPFHIAAVFYVNAVEGHPDLEILDPRPPHNFNICYGKTAKGETTGGSRSLRFKPERNKLLLFPGYLNHGVGTNLLDEQRICVAMNINVR
jgi:uncharacterized protein (TIGR02466 family)